MSDEVVVTRKGQTTIPVRLRTKYGIEEGTRLIVVDTGDGVAFKRAVTISDLAGSGAVHSTPKAMKSRLDKIREEDI
jgi:AbrB family looped-hinge helix DNA binding protein